MKKLTLLLTTFLALASCRLYEPNRYARNTLPPGAPQTRILMIGDSLTYYNDLPGLLQQLSSKESAPIYIEQVTTPYFSLKAHWNIGKAQEKIRTGHFDYVILQDFSRKPVTDPEDSAKYFALYTTLAQSTGAKVILFENWTRKGHEEDFPALQSAYQSIQQQTHATLAPIGHAWNHSLDVHPNIILLLDDRHPTDAGTYLTACVLYDVLYKKPSSDLPLSLPAPNLPQELLQFLRRTADESAFPQEVE